jgi:type III secretory pathway component EscT
VPSLSQSVADAVAGVDSATDWFRLGLAWARALPLVTLVPAFGLRALPAPARVVLGLAIAATYFPAIPLVAPEAAGAAPPWIVQALVEAARGLPVALAAAVPLWAATMAGGVADALRGSRDAASSPVVEGSATPLGVPLSILASAIFLTTGGPARAAAALALAQPTGNPLVAAVNDLVSGIAFAVALAGPLLAAAVVIEVAGALVARAASPAQVHALLAPLRALAVLAVTAIAFERIATVLARAIER